MFEQEIKAGVARLDEHYGRETWLSKVSLSRLNMASPYDCLLAQLEEKSYHDARLELDLSADQAEQCGFYITRRTWANRPGLLTMEEEYEKLTDEWKQTISALRG